MPKEVVTVAIVSGAAGALVASAVGIAIWRKQQKNTKPNKPPPINVSYQLLMSNEPGQLPDIPPHAVESNLLVRHVYLLPIRKLGGKFPSADVDNSVMKTSGAKYMNLVTDDVILTDIVRTKKGPPFCRAFTRAGPHRTLHFNPSDVRAVIVTCGGLCPGLNNVIREITNTLYFSYGCTSVFGVKGGYAGFGNEPLVLTPDSVAEIHHRGGTVLGSSRGGFDLAVITKFISDHQINQVYIIGGDGTHRGALKVSSECERLGLNVAVVGVPKTIDNDIGLIDRSFGFETAVEVAQEAIKTATTEAICNVPNGIGIVKLMGRSTGFIAAFACLASGDVDLCLIPEIPIQLEGAGGCLEHLEARLKERGHAVVVVAEGAGAELMKDKAKPMGTDKSGNPKLPPIGVFMQEQIEHHFERIGNPATVKYIDPSYMIRSVCANSADSRYCMQLGQNAVHGAMAGQTDFSVGLCNNRVVLIPMTAIIDSSPRMMRPDGRTWERVLAITRQPKKSE
eukprot:c21378_g1_i1.p1 GENE.c21378_g1_i1~~c21378_g1_i1.p1  ORF type:complete len:508 (+),score=108.32 c21378_g1_i1:78-1601(+)